MESELTWTAESLRGEVATAGSRAAISDEAESEVPSPDLYRLLAEQATNLERLAARINQLTRHESETRALLEVARDQIAVRDAALQQLRSELQIAVQERDQMRASVREAFAEMESRDLSIESLRKKLRKLESRSQGTSS